MKKIFTIAFAAMAAISISAQTTCTQMRVWSGDKVVAQRDIENIDSVTFVENTVVGPTIANGALMNGEFSVGPGRKVHFSQGNLQYQPYSDTWRFARYQFDYVGSANTSISPTADWIDLFCWGTSGWNSGAHAYLPYSVAPQDTNYYVGGSVTNNLTGAYANADWGVYNAISNGGNKAGLWRVLTQEEWDYIINKRTNYENLRGWGQIEGVKGIILLPDGWVCPDGLSIDVYAFSSAIEKNIYTFDQWVKMECNGAVFLPMAGNLQHTPYYGDVTHSYYDNNGYGIGTYWTSICTQNEYAYCLSFSNNYYFSAGMVSNTKSRHLGCSVRLVQDL